MSCVWNDNEELAARLNHEVDHTLEVRVYDTSVGTFGKEGTERLMHLVSTKLVELTFDIRKAGHRRVFKFEICDCTQGFLSEVKYSVTGVALDEVRCHLNTLQF